MSAARIWRRWLGEAGTPGPLDRLLARERPEPAAFRSLILAATWGATVAEALAPGDAPVLERLRGLDDREVLAGAALCGGGAAPEPIRRAMRALRRRLDADPSWASACLRHGIPAGFAPSVERRAERSGEEVVRRWLASQTSRPPLQIRPRDPGVADALRAEGYRVTPARAGDRLRDGRPQREPAAAAGRTRSGRESSRKEPASAQRVAGVRADGQEPGRAQRVCAQIVVGRRGIETSGPYREGRLEVQDAASQECGALAALSPGQIGWDVCAGRGGKAVQMAEGLDGRGALQATDIDERKLAALKVRLRRAGLSGVVRLRRWDGTAVPDFGPEARGGFDVVLVDAPCSSSGTWRRNPDARLRVDPEELPRFPELQQRLLELGAQALGPRGRLVYATCSFRVEEDEAVAEAVAERAGLAIRQMGWFGPPELDSDTLFAAVLSR